MNIPPAILPRVVGSIDVAGLVTKQATRTLGLPTGIPVVGGGTDNAIGSVGSGVVNVGSIQYSIGTPDALLIPIDRSSIDRGMRLHTFCHCVPN